MGTWQTIDYLSLVLYTVIVLIGFPGNLYVLVAFIRNRCARQRHKLISFIVVIGTIGSLALPFLNISSIFVEGDGAAKDGAILEIILLLSGVTDDVLGCVLLATVSALSVYQAESITSIRGVLPKRQRIYLYIGLMAFTALVVDITALAMNNVFQGHLDVSPCKPSALDLVHMIVVLQSTIEWLQLVYLVISVIIMAYSYGRISHFLQGRFNQYAHVFTVIGGPGGIPESSNGGEVNVISVRHAWDDEFGHDSTEEIGPMVVFERRTRSLRLRSARKINTGNLLRSRSDEIATKAVNLPLTINGRIPICNDEFCDDIFVQSQGNSTHLAYRYQDTCSSLLPAESSLPRRKNYRADYVHEKKENSTGGMLANSEFPLESDLQLCCYESTSGNVPCSNAEISSTYNQGSYEGSQNGGITDVPVMACLAQRERMLQRPSEGSSVDDVFTTSQALSCVNLKGESEFTANDYSELEFRFMCGAHSMSDTSLRDDPHRKRRGYFGQRTGYTSQSRNILNERLRSKMTRLLKGNARRSMAPLSLDDDDRTPLSSDVSFHDSEDCGLDGSSLRVQTHCIGGTCADRRPKVIHDPNMHRGESHRSGTIFGDKIQHQERNDEESKSGGCINMRSDPSLLESETNAAYKQTTNFHLRYNCKHHSKPCCTSKGSVAGSNGNRKSRTALLLRSSNRNTGLNDSIPPCSDVSSGDCAFRSNLEGYINCASPCKGYNRAPPDVPKARKLQDCREMTPVELESYYSPTGSTSVDLLPEIRERCERMSTSSTSSYRSWSGVEASPASLMSHREYRGTSRDDLSTRGELIPAFPFGTRSSMETQSISSGHAACCSLPIIRRCVGRVRSRSFPLSNATFLRTETLSLPAGPRCTQKGLSASAILHSVKEQKLEKERRSLRAIIRRAIIYIIVLAVTQLPKTTFSVHVSQTVCNLSGAYRFLSAFSSTYYAMLPLLYVRLNKRLWADLGL